MTDHREPGEQEDPMDVTNEYFDLVDRYLADELSPAMHARVEDRLRTDQAFRAYALPLIEGVNVLRDPKRPRADEEDAELTGPSDEALAELYPDAELEPLFRKFARENGLRDDWWTDESAEEFDALVERRSKVQLVVESQAKVVGATGETRDGAYDRRVIKLPKRRSILIAALSAAAGAALAVAPMRIAAYREHKAALSQSAAEELHLHMPPAGRETFYNRSGQSPIAWVSSDGTIQGTLARGVLNLQTVGTKGDSLVEGTLDVNGEVFVTVGPKSRGMLLHTPTADLTLARGRYYVNAPNTQVGSITVVEGFAYIDDRGRTAHDVTTAYAGETVKTRAGQLPTRDMHEPDVFKP